jgi:hypothetical protein
LNFACHSTLSCSAPPPVFARQRGDALPRHGRVAHCSAMQSAATPAHVAALHARLTATPARTRFDSAKRPLRAGRRSGRTRGQIPSARRCPPSSLLAAARIVSRSCCCVASHADVARMYRMLHQCHELQCTGLQCSALRCGALQCGAVQCGALHCTALHCTAGMDREARPDATCNVLQAAYNAHITRIQRAFNAHSSGADRQAR